MRAKTQQLLRTQDSLKEAQEDLARDEVIFGGKVKELRELREANEQLQVSHAVPRRETYIRFRIIVLLHNFACGLYTVGNGKLNFTCDILRFTGV